MSAISEQRTTINELTLLKLAREIAMDILPMENILNTHQIDSYQWDNIQNSPRFQELLRSETEAWNSATNTAERVRLKSLSFVEEALPEFFSRAHDSRETLTAKNEVLKTVARFAGIGASGMDSAILGEKFFVTINLGADQTFKIEKDVTSKVIDHDE